MKSPRVLFLVLGLLGGLALTPGAQAQSVRFSVRDGSDILRLQAGADRGLLGCPCARTIYAVEVGAGQIQVFEWILSSQALLRFREDSGAVFNGAFRRTWRVGSFEGVHSGTGIGLAFDGVRLGTDVDRGMADLISSGGSLLYRLLFHSQVFAELTAGYRYEGFEWNGVAPVNRNEFPLSIGLNWAHPNFRGRITLLMAPQSGGRSGIRYLAELDTAARFRLPLRADFVGVGMGLASQIERDPLLMELGMPGTWISGRAYLEVSWIAPRVP